MLLSMTGFGAASNQVPNKKITVEVKSLNSKQLDFNCRIPLSLRSLEPVIRNLVAEKAERGKIDLNVSVENTDEAIGTRLNISAIKAYKKQIEEISAELDLPLPGDWYAVLTRLPDVMTTAEEENEETAEQTKEAVLKTIGEALTALMDYRRAEGVRLEEFFLVRIARIRELLAEVPKFESERIERIKTRLADGLSKISGVDYDKGRLEQEMIFYIEKLDVNEEKQRLTQHLNYFVETVGQPEPGQGKKLGFIAQEMGREINTLGSKSNHAELQKLVVMMKDELEQIKEQVLNVM